MMDTLGSWVSLNAGLPPTASDLRDGRRGILLVEHCRDNVSPALVAALRQEIIHVA